MAMSALSKIKVFSRAVDVVAVIIMIGVLADAYLEHYSWFVTAGKIVLVASIALGLTLSHLFRDDKIVMTVLKQEKERQHQ